VKPKQTAEATLQRLMQGIQSYTVNLFIHLLFQLVPSYDTSIIPHIETEYNTVIPDKEKSRAPIRRPARRDKRFSRS
jgi:hypothetical protein